MTNPHSLQKDGFGFVKLKPRTKIPLEHDWQNKPYSHSEIQPWIDQGGNYGVQGGYGGLIIIDADSPEIDEIVKNHFPETLTVRTPRRGNHYYYLCDGIDKKIILKKGTANKNDHLGEIITKGFQVVGAGSIHPDTGTEYECINDVEIATISRELIYSEFIEYIPVEYPQQDAETEVSGISVVDVLNKTGVQLRKVGSQFVCSHPVHGSTNGNNFVVNPEKDAWHCFRCNTGGGALSLIAVLEGIIDCHDAVPGALRGNKFTQVQRVAKEKYGFGVKEYNPLDAAVQRLSALSPLQYDQVRKTEATALGVRPVTLDAAVKDARKGSNTDNLPFTEVAPWPEPVDPATLLTDIAATIRRFIVCDKEVSHAVALWVAMTWFIDVVQVAPLAVITSPEKRCGKTLLLSLLRRLSAKAVAASNISPAALFRTIEAWHPTLLIDEADSFMKNNEELRGLLNSGHTRDSAYAIRTVGDNFTPTTFNTWGAKAIAGILVERVADTLTDRAVILGLRRKLPHEEVDRLRNAEPVLFTELCSKLARFAEDYCEQVEQARPPLPGSLNDRALDNWEPLLAIAMIAGKEWLQIGTAAALALSGKENESQTIGTELLGDIQKIFKNKQADKISSAELISSLCADEERPWSTYNRGKEITPRQLANKLKGFGIHSKTIRLETETAKGYEYEQFKETFDRYLSVTNPPKNNSVPVPPFLSVTMSQSNNINELHDFQSVTQGGNVTDKNEAKYLKSQECDLVTDKNPLPERKNKFSPLEIEEIV